MEFSPTNSAFESWFDRCSELCSSLTRQGCKYTFSLNLEGSFSFSLSSEKAVLPRTKKRSPSYMRRQLRRKADLLNNRSGLSPAENATGHLQEEAAAVDISPPLNLCPKPVYTYRSRSEICMISSYILYKYCISLYYPNPRIRLSVRPSVRPCPWPKDPI